MKKHWFRNKKYGWGWYPNTWQGWLVIGLYTVSFVGLMLNLRSEGVANKEVIWDFLPKVAILTAILLFICFATGDTPGWHWGDRDEASEKEKIK